MAAPAHQAQQSCPGRLGVLPSTVVRAVARQCAPQTQQVRGGLLDHFWPQLYCSQQLHEDTACCPSGLGMPQGFNMVCDALTHAGPREPTKQESSYSDVGPCSEASSGEENYSESIDVLRSLEAPTTH